MTREGSGGRSTIHSYPNATRPHLNIKERVWHVPADMSPIAGLVVIHGGNWHSGWFGELGDLLSSESHRIRVSAPDLPSHGLSDDIVPPYRAYIPDFSEAANEVCSAVSRSRSALPEGCPIFLLGESMGGVAALHALVLNDGTRLAVDGLLLCGTVIKPAPEVVPPRVVFELLRLVAWFLPTMRIPGEGVGGKTFDEAFGDPDVPETATADPLVTRASPPRLSFGVSFMSATALVEKEAAVKITMSKVMATVCIYFIMRP